jgi:hypothetical protein
MSLAAETEEFPVVQVFAVTAVDGQLDALDLQCILLRTDTGDLESVAGFDVCLSPRADAPAWSAGPASFHALNREKQVVDPILGTRLPRASSSFSGRHGASPGLHVTVAKYAGLRGN